MCIRDRPPRLNTGVRFPSPAPSTTTIRLKRSTCLLYTSDAADDLTRVDLGGRRFFQAEDGIRDLVRSRGLGDVYKRQATTAEYGGSIPLTRSIHHHDQAQTLHHEHQTATTAEYGGSIPLTRSIHHHDQPQTLHHEHQTATTAQYALS